MPDLPYGGGSQQAALAEGVGAISSALLGLARQQQAAQTEARNAFINAGIASEYLNAKQIIDRNFLNLMSSFQTDPDDGTFIERYNKESQEWIAEAKKEITLPAAAQKLDEYLASESGLKKQQEELAAYSRNRLATKGEIRILKESNTAVANGDWETLETLRDDPIFNVYNSTEDISNYNDKLIPEAKYNSVYNKLSSLSPELALQLVKNPEDAKQLGIDMSVLTPEQTDAMVKQIQLERDYAVGQQDKADALTIGKSDQNMLTAEIALLTGKGDSSTWLSPEMVGKQQWPGDEGARKAKTWLDALKADLNYLKEETVAENLDAVYAIAFNPNLTDQQKKDKIRTMPGVSGEDRAKVMNVVDMAKMNPAYGQAAAQVIDAYQRSMSLGAKKDVKETAAESVRAQRQLEDMWIKNPGNIPLLNQTVDQILQGITAKDVENAITQETGVTPTGYATKEYRKAYKTATAYEYAREQGIVPVGAATKENIEKAHALELDAFKNSKMPEKKSFYSVMEDGSYIYSSTQIVKDKTGNILIDKSGPLYQVLYQIKPGARDSYEYVPSIYQMNTKTYQFDILIWEQK